MKAKKCGMSEDEKHFRRLNYCGTCKTIGALYGQKSRFLLNHDTVFLAEILSALSGEEVSDWQKSYQSYNCLNMPKGEMPLSLQFAATTNIILTEFKLADHIADEKKRRYKLARDIFSKEFQTAEKLLTGWNFPLDEVKAILASQNLRETAESSLDDPAFPTAQTTAIFFREGVKKIGKNELGKLAFDIGFNFGKLVYLLDAFEDYEKDLRTKQFNAFRAAFDLTDEKLSADTKRKISTVLHAVESEISSKIYELPIAENQKTLFISRLSQNLQRKLKPSLPVLSAKKVCAPKPKQTFAQRWQTASEKARGLAYQYGWQMPLVFLFVFAFALVAPAQSREARSARECFDLSFNLMFLSAIFASVMAFPKTLLMENPEEVLTKKGRRKKLAQAAGGGSDDSDSWCDTCCCCCDCGDGFCDGCDCCSGCCDNCGCDGCGDCCDCSCDC